MAISCLLLNMLQSNLTLNCCSSYILGQFNNTHFYPKMFAFICHCIISEKLIILWNCNFWPKTMQFLIEHLGVGFIPPF